MKKILNFLSNKSRDYKDDSKQEYLYNKKEEKKIVIDIDAGSTIRSFNYDVTGLADYVD